MATSFYNRVKVAVGSAPGTGAVALGAAVPGYRSFTDASVADGATVSYTIEDGTNWELGHGTYTAATGSLARTTVIASSNANAAISASAQATLFLTILAEDLAALAGSGGSGGGTTPGSSAAPLRPVASISARYWRLNALRPQSGNYVGSADVAWLDNTDVKLTPSSVTSSHDTDPVANAWDNDPTTFWTTDVVDGTGYIAFDFGQPVTPRTVTLLPRPGYTTTQSLRQASIDYSTDAQNWTTVNTFHCACPWTGDAQKQMFSTAAPLNDTSIAAHRYWRIDNLLNNHAANYIGTGELTFFDSYMRQIPAFAVFSNGADTDPIGQGWDDDLTTYWTTSDTTGGGFLALDFLVPKQPCYVRISSRNQFTSCNIQTLDVSYSDDNSTWSKQVRNVGVPVWSTNDNATRLLEIQTSTVQSLLSTDYSGIIQRATVPLSSTVTLNHPPTKGNVLLFCALHNHAGAAVPSGFTLISNTDGSNDGVTWSYRAVDGTEGRTFGPASPNPPYTCAVWELQNVDTTTFAPQAALSSSGSITVPKLQNSMVVGLSACRGGYELPNGPRAPANARASQSTLVNEDRSVAMWSDAQNADTQYQGTFAASPTAATADNYTVACQVLATKVIAAG